MSAEAFALLAELEARLRPLEVAVSRAWWEANTSASEESELALQQAELRLREVLGDPGAFAAVTEAITSAPKGSWERRQLKRLQDSMTPHQLDEEMRRQLVGLETKVEVIFNTHRGEIDGQRVDDNRIAELLRGSHDVVLRREAWEASKSVGEVVAGSVLELVRLRNRAAVTLGYTDHYSMSLALNELDDQRLLATLEEVDRLTAEPFRRWKAAIDQQRARRFSCELSDLRPWHYDDPFLQEAPPPPGLDLDGVFAEADLEALTLETYDGIGLDMRGVLARSDLYSREAKSQHAFCIDLDRLGDVRVLCNVVGNERWMETLLHEFGHAAYDIGIDRTLPFLLRVPAHMLTTEAVAMLFERLVHQPRWLSRVAGVSDAEVRQLRNQLGEARRSQALVFARWALVMCQFESALYRDPEGDHDTRWWDLVNRYQLVSPPSRTAPDWAAKIHLAVAPVYYQNYLYGELVASQLSATLETDAGGLVKQPRAGRWLTERVFRPGASRRWDQLIEDATGHPLTARHLADELAVG